MIRRNKPDNTENNAEKLVNKNTGFLGWLQEFSKKVVAITFVIFLIINVFVMVFIALHYFVTGDIIYLDQLLAEAHTTFRDVIGGYIIKAATENVIKISGSVVEKFLENKLQAKEMDHEFSMDSTSCGNELPLDDPNYIPEQGGKG